MSSVNFKNKYFYQHKFGRDPKEWSIEQLHELYLKAKKRSDERSKIFWNLLLEAVEKTGQKTIYYYQKRGDGKEQLCHYDIRYNHDYESYSYSRNYSKLEDRDSKLAFFIADEINFEYGRKLQEASKFYSLKLSSFVFSILEDEVNQILNKKFKSEKISPPKSFVTKIGDKSYIIETSDIGRLGAFDRGFSWKYNQFKIVCECQEISLEENCTKIQT